MSGGCSQLQLVASLLTSSPAQPKRHQKRRSVLPLAHHPPAREIKAANVVKNGDISPLLHWSNKWGHLALIALEQVLQVLKMQPIWTSGRPTWERPYCTLHVSFMDFHCLRRGGRWNHRVWREGWVYGEQCVQGLLAVCKQPACLLRKLT